MRSTFAGLNTMVRGINTNQLSLDTIGHNITNANTQGYSRQRVNQAATNSQNVQGFFGYNQIGSGVDALSIVRLRDVFADQQYWKDQSTTEQALAKQYTYDKVEAIFQDVGDVGLNNKINAFWQSWKSLNGTGASDNSKRVVVRDAGDNLAQLIQKDAKDMQQLLQDNNSKLMLDVGSANRLIKSIYDLNKSIFRSESTGGMANDLRDQRDAAVDELASLINVNVKEDSNGFFQISCSGATLVEQGSYSELATRTTPNAEYGTNDVTLIMKDTGVKLNVASGSIKGVQESIEIAKDYIDDLALMSAFLLTDFNEQHKKGYGMNDEHGVNFFGQDGTIDPATGGGSITYTYDAANQRVVVQDSTPPATTTYLNKVEAIKALDVNNRFYETDQTNGMTGTDLIGAKSAKGPAQNTASGNNAYILGDLLYVRPGSISSVQPPNVESTMLGGNSLLDFYTGVTTKMGDDARAVDDTVIKQEDTMVQIESWRGQTSGVNWQEELTDMIRYQQGFSSCSRCLTTMDEMLDKLINSTGVVGR